MTRAVGILGLGHYVPEKIITNTDMEKIVETSDEWITERTGIKQRHIAAPEGSRYRRHCFLRLYFPVHCLPGTGSSGC